MIRDREEAEDILQEVFLAFWNKIEGINEKTHLAYLYRTAYNRTINRIKKIGRSKEFPVDSIEKLQPYIQEDEVNTNTNDDLSNLVANALSKLKTKESILIELQYFQKMSYAEIADKLGLSLSAVDSRLFRAKQKLKKIISQDMQPTTV